MTTLRVSIATFAIRRYARLDDMVEHVSCFAGAAAAAGSDVLLLPEMANVGLLWSQPIYAALGPREIGNAYREVLTPLFAPFVAAMIEVAVRYGIAIVGPSFWHAPDGVGTNSALTFLPDGNVRRQDKVHPTRPEVAIDTKGSDRLDLFEIKGVKVATLICYDVQFPELARALVDRGIRILFVPSLTSDRGYWRVRYGSHARAIENQMYVCVSPLFGDLGIPAEHPLQCHGGAYVTCPIDNRLGIEDGLLASAARDVEGLLTVDLDTDLLDLSREKGEIRPLRDRRPDLYAEL